MAEEDRNTLLMLGEIRAQLSFISENTAAIRADVVSLTARVNALENDRSERAGRDGVLYAILRSPFVAWLAATGATVWAVLNGRTP